MNGILAIAYGRELKQIFNKQLYIVPVVDEDGVCCKKIIRDNGRNLIGMKCYEIVPLVDKDIDIGYLLVNEKLYNNLYNEFYMFSQYHIGRTTLKRKQPIYCKVAILNRNIQVDIATALISPDKPKHPAMIVNYNGKVYEAKFKDFEIERLYKRS